MHWSNQNRSTAHILTEVRIHTRTVNLTHCVRMTQFALPIRDTSEQMTGGDSNDTQD